MHIEPSVVDGAKIVLSYVTAAASFAIAGKLALDTIRNDGGIVALATRSLIAIALVFCFFEVLPHYPSGISEVHFILGATLYLIFGAGPAAIGLSAGLLLQGLFFAPSDLPMYFVNATTLLVPLWATSELAQRAIPHGTAYINLKYWQVVTLSIAYQSGIIAWVAFWAFYGQGLGVENIQNVLGFSSAYLVVILVEPILDFLILISAKRLTSLSKYDIFYCRLYHSKA